MAPWPRFQDWGPQAVSGLPGLHPSGWLRLVAGWDKGSLGRSWRDSRHWRLARMAEAAWPGSRSVEQEELFITAAVGEVGGEAWGPWDLLGALTPPSPPGPHLWIPCPPAPCTASDTPATPSLLWLPLPHREVTPSRAFPGGVPSSWRACLSSHAPFSPTVVCCSAKALGHGPLLQGASPDFGEVRMTLSTHRVSGIIESSPTTA